MPDLFWARIFPARAAFQRPSHALQGESLIRVVLEKLMESDSQRDLAMRAVLNVPCRVFWLEASRLLL